MPLPLEVITSFEKATVCNSLHTETQPKFYSLLLEMRRHKMRCSCEACINKSLKVMDLIRTTPQIANPPVTDSETNDATFDSNPFREGWDICLKIFEIIRTCHSAPNNIQNKFQIYSINRDKLTACPIIQIRTPSKINSLATETPSDLQRGSWKDSDASDSEFSILG